MPTQVLLPVPVEDLADALATDGTLTLHVLADMAATGSDAELDDFITGIACAHDASMGHRAVAPFLRRVAEALEFVEADLPGPPARRVPL